MSDRTFKIGKDSYMRGDDVKSWQREVKALFKKMNIDCPIVVDGIYGVHTRSYTASLVHANGMNAGTQMKNGVTPALRTKLRHAPKSLTEAQKKTRTKRKEYRAKLRKRWSAKVHPPVAKIITDSWGYHPGVHDGVDVICNPNATLYAMVKSRVIDVRAGGWWGKAPSGDVSKGDGIVQLEVLENVGPFKKGQHIGYGHCEHAKVKVGQVVEAGTPIALAGLAVAWHIHLMVNDGQVGTRGVGTRDPRPHLDYAVKHG